MVRTTRRRRAAAAAGGAAAAGTVAALSLPPWGWWPLGPVGVGGLALLLAGRPAPARLGVGAAFGLGLFIPGLWWMGEFNAAGAGAVMVLETAFVALAAVAAPSRRWQAAGLPAALVLAEAARSSVPFGGLPMAGLALGQAGGPLLDAARLGGHLLVLALAAAAGVGLARLASRRWAAGAAALAVATMGAVAGALAPDGGGGPPLRAALVQGGGPRGFRGVDVDPSSVFAWHLAASEAVRPPVDLVLWPEDVVDVEGPVTAAPEGERLAEVAGDLEATLVVGVVEGAGPDRFRNAAVAWSPSGEVVDRFDKVHRVPFGEYVPGRALFARVADLSVIPRDAIAGRGPGVLTTPAGRFGVLISYEVFFAERGRAAARAGGRLLLVPTNASSYSTAQVPTQQLAAARLRAVESGRDLLQAAPTGYTAVIDHRGTLRARSVLGRRQVLHATVALRSGRTPYVRVGDAPVLVLAVAALAAAWAPAPRRPRRQRQQPGQRQQGGP